MESPAAENGQQCDEAEAISQVRPSRVSTVSTRRRREDPGLEEPGRYAMTVPPDGFGVHEAIIQTHDVLLKLVDLAIDTEYSRERATFLREFSLEMLSHSFAARTSLFASLLHFRETRDKAQRAIEEQCQLRWHLYDAIGSFSGCLTETEALSALREELILHIERVESRLLVSGRRCLPRLQDRNPYDQYAQLKAGHRKILAHYPLGARGVSCMS